jgi:D-threo-aldose 1-dehydrogenase
MSMSTLPLASTGRQTTRLGFGCSSLMGATGRRESLSLLEHAFASGIRHFDVAPMYGYGAAEGCLGEFLARHPGEVTVATKYGIPPPPNQGLLRAARRAIGPLLKLVPSVKKRLAGAANTVTAAVSKPPLTAAAARASLDHSLRELRTERLDLLLLHEAEAADLGDDALLRFLEDAVRAGIIGAFGCGSSADKVPALLAHKPRFCPVLQFEWSVLDKPLESIPGFRLHHRALTANFAELRDALGRDTEARQRWSQEAGADLQAPGMLAALMLKAALVLNPDSIILVSSRDPGHITRNVRVAEDDSLAEPARRLYELAQREGASVLVRS